MPKTTTFTSLQATALLLVACVAVGLVADCHGRTLPNEKRRVARSNSTAKTNKTAAPLHHRQLRRRRQTFDNKLHGPESYNARNFPDSNAVNSTGEHPPESCYHNATMTYRRMVYEYAIDGTLEKKEENVTRVERRCCDGWKGDDCNMPPLSCYQYAIVTYWKTVHDYTTDGDREKKRVNVTRVERRCCDGWTGDDCNEPQVCCYQHATVTYPKTVYEYTTDGVWEKKEVNVTRVERRCCDGWKGDSCKESCYQYANVTYRETVYEYTIDGVLEKKEVNVTRVERRCCDSWTGDDCNNPPESCYQYAKATYRKTVYEYTIDGVIEEKEQNVTRMERRCCDGWKGDDCNKPPESCYQYATATYRITVHEYTIDGVLEEREENLTRVERRCCDGWTGDECNTPPPVPTLR